MKPGKQHFYLILGQLFGLISREDIIKQLIDDGFSFEMIEEFGLQTKKMVNQVYANADKNSADKQQSPVAQN